MASGFGLIGVDKGGLAGKSLFKNFNQLRSEGDFRDKQDDGAALGARFGGESEVEIGFAGAGDTVKETSGGAGSLERGEGGALSGIERNAM